MIASLSHTDKCSTLLLSLSVMLVSLALFIWWGRSSNSSKKEKHVGRFLLVCNTWLEKGILQIERTASKCLLEKASPYNTQFTASSGLIGHTWGPHWVKITARTHFHGEVVILTVLMSMMRQMTDRSPGRVQVLHETKIGSETDHQVAGSNFDVSVFDAGLLGWSHGQDRVQEDWNNSFFLDSESEIRKID